MKQSSAFGFLQHSMLALILLFSNACQKEINASAEQETKITEEATFHQGSLELEFDDVFNLTMGLGSETGEDLGIVGGISIFSSAQGDTYVQQVDSAVNARCFSITITPRDRGVFPKTVIMDFGAGCRARDGRLRKGKIITVFSGSMGRPGSTATTTFDGYKVDSITVTGTHTVSNISTSNQRSFSVNVSNGKLTWDSGRWVSCNSTRTIKQIEGNGTPMLPADDVFTITGEGSGANSNGSSWAHQITSPLYKKFTCRWLVKGILSITRNTTAAKLDFGDGGCDDKAILTINGVSKEISLR